MAEVKDKVVSLEILGDAYGQLSGQITNHSGNKNNPHNVTLSQLGLSASATELNYMDGVTSNVQTQLNTISNKITDHTGNKNNPHGVTYTQIGAAPTSHKHSASDINSGALPIERGGTGATTAAAARTSLGAAASSHNHSKENLQPESIDLTPKSTSAGTGGVIDFHYNASTADYTTRLFEANGVLNIQTPSSLGAILLSSNITCVKGASVSFSGGVGSYSHSFIDSNTTVIVQRNGYGTNGDAMSFATTVSSGKVNICASQSFNATLNINIIMIKNL